MMFVVVDVSCQLLLMLLMLLLPLMLVISCCCFSMYVPIASNRSDIRYAFYFWISQELSWRISNLFSSVGKFFFFHENGKPIDNDNNNIMMPILRWRFLFVKES